MVSQTNKPFRLFLFISFIQNLTEYSLALADVTNLFLEP